MGTGKRIKELAKKRGIPLKQLASNAGISYNTLYSIVKRDSNRVQGDILQAISSTLGVPLIDLLEPKEAQERSLSAMEKIIFSGEKLEPTEQEKETLSKDQQREFNETTAKFNLLMDELNALPDDERQKMIDAVLTLIGSKKEPPQPE